VRSVSIVDIEARETAGTLYADGRLDTDDDALRAAYREIMDAGGPKVMDGYAGPEDGDISEGFVSIEPGERGFLVAFVDELSSPYDAPPERRRELPSPDLSGEAGVNPPEEQ
jgi:hypothetical protein